MGIGNLTNSLAVLALQGDGTSFWMPPKGSATAAQVDWLFYFIFYISLFFFGLIVVLMILFIIKYRRRPGREEAEETAHHNTLLEVIWSVIPLALVIAIFWTGFKVYLNMAVPPQNAYEIRVTGQKWQWLFTYPNGWVDSELHAPKGIPVKLTMTSEDVIHSLYVPDFRMKKDVVPGRYTTTWFKADNVGEHSLFCAEYCGTEHSGMVSRVVVQEPEDYLAWLENAASFYDELPPAEAGEQMLSKYGCVQCHNTDSRAGTGPPLNDIFGHEVELTGGQSVLVDDNYVRNSILDPGSQIVRGYQGVMPTYQGKIKDKEIDWVIAYLKSISQYYEEPALLPGLETGGAAAANGGEDGAASDGGAPPPEAADETADGSGDAPVADGGADTAETTTEVDAA